ncbi:hypothetical protein POX_d05725 [Penicillium oxalicum]|uniref:Uncharacterized protein n=1 Tax=Penicillium oxalicum (strain 114-2 / CGMCC 5302) TaxID=933388 RepID=S7ZTK2_PENO1|nr:hypothetical protein POX_d05725 [Penicillium oxalicum]EPS32101.1 hypothetical protein PDE_07060 [Penicillium oxalicum 114-2]KAI2790219.1 hypothetical protein POX_d05725 [Penicillium oxalicum]
MHKQQLTELIGSPQVFSVSYLVVIQASRTTSATRWTAVLWPLFRRQSTAVKHRQHNESGGSKSHAYLQIPAQSTPNKPNPLTGIPTSHCLHSVT